jgi:CheY-like chemotaxis protein
MKRIRSILLVDDDKANNYLTQLLLEDMDVADQIFVAENGQEAMHFIATNPVAANSDNPDLQVILLDINMPVMDGFEFLGKFQNFPVSKHIHVIMLTTSVHPKDLEKAKTFQVSYYLNKPITEEKLAEVFAQL